MLAVMALALIGASGVAMWLCFPVNGEGRPFMKIPLLEWLIPVAIVSGFAIGGTMLAKAALTHFASMAGNSALSLAFVTPALAQGSPYGGEAGLDLFQKGYFVALASALFAIWFFKVRPNGRNGVRDWALAIAGVCGFVGTVLLLVKLAGH